MFPDDPPDLAMSRLWEAIFETSRINNDDPVTAWKEHDARLQKRAALLNDKRYAALQYRGPGTDFRLGLADDHLWVGGDGWQWHLLHSEYSDRRSLHHTA
jgi:aminopeptidase